MATQEEKQIKTAARRQFVSGNRLFALGAVAAGCRFFSGYPITPSSEIFQTMMLALIALTLAQVVQVRH